MKETDDGSEKEEKFKEGNQMSKEPFKC